MRGRFDGSHRPTREIEQKGASERRRAFAQSAEDRIVERPPADAPVRLTEARRKAIRKKSVDAAEEAAPPEKNDQDACDGGR